MSQWVIYDDGGVIAQGSEEEMRALFEQPQNDVPDRHGDLVLARIEAVRR